MNNSAPIIFGNDYDTRDGTCVRDYIDVRYIANLLHSASGLNEKLPLAMNVGTGMGVSVLDVFHLVLREFGDERLRPTFESRREGDAEFLCADTSLLKSYFDIETQFSIKESIQSLRANLLQ